MFGVCGRTYGTVDSSICLTSEQPTLIQLFENMKRKQISPLVGPEFDKITEENFVYMLQCHLSEGNQNTMEDRLTGISCELINVVRSLIKMCGNNSDHLSLVLENLLQISSDIRIINLHKCIEETCESLIKQLDLNKTLKYCMDKANMLKSFKIFQFITERHIENKKLSMMDGHWFFTQTVKYWTTALNNEEMLDHFLKLLDPVHNYQARSHLYLMIHHPKLFYMNKQLLFFLSSLNKETLQISNKKSISNIFSYISSVLLRKREFFNEWMHYVLFNLRMKETCNWLNVDGALKTNNSDHSHENYNHTDSVLNELKSFLMMVIQSDNKNEITISKIIETLLKMGKIFFCSLKITADISPFISLTLSILNELQQNTFLFKRFSISLHDWLTIGKVKVMTLNRNNYPIPPILIKNLTTCLQISAKISNSSLGSNKLSTNIHPSYFGKIDEFNFEEEFHNIENSDDESLSQIVCTYSTTHTEFLSQHWYYCYTCK